MGLNQWQARWLAMCDLIASWSKDRSTRYGAVIVGENQRVLSLGWNGFPRGVDDDRNERHERPEKYYWTEHAERNAIYNAAAHGVSLRGSTLYVNGIPCADCARAIAQSGIIEIVIQRLPIQPRWQASYQAAARILYEAGVNVTVANREPVSGGTHSDEQK